MLSREAEGKSGVNREINPRVHRAFINDMRKALDFHIYNASPVKDHDSPLPDNETRLKRIRDVIEKKSLRLRTRTNRIPPIPPPMINKQKHFFCMVAEEILWGKGL